MFSSVEGERLEGVFSVPRLCGSEAVGEEDDLVVEPGAFLGGGEWLRFKTRDDAAGARLGFVRGHKDAASPCDAAF